MSSLKRLAIVTSHPIQYNAPMFKLLASRKKVQPKIFYTWGESVLKDKFDPGFGKSIQWDIPLLEGYDFQFLKNIAVQPGTSHFNGIDNPDIITAINKFQPDAILVYGWSWKSHLKVMRHFKGKVPILFRGDSTCIDKTGFIAKLKRKLFLSFVYKHVDKALYVGASNRSYFLEFGLKPHQLHFAPHAIDNDRFTLTPEVISKAKELRKSMHIGEQDNVFLFAAKLEPKKAPGILVEAFKESQLPKDAHLVIVGDGVLKSEVINKAAGHPNIHFLPFQNQSLMPAVYQMSDMFVLPSIYQETWGLAINEAMSIGKPIIASNACGCVKDLVHDNKNGYVFEAGNKSQLLSTLQKAYQHQSDWVKMGECSKDIIKNYRLENVCAAIEKVVNE